MDEHQEHPNPDSTPEGDGTPPEAAGADNATGDDANKDIAPAFELVEITWRGKTWTIPKDRGQWDMNVQFEFEEGRRMRGLLILLGGSPDNIARTKEEVYRLARTNGEVEELMDHCTAILNKECVG